MAYEDHSPSVLIVEDDPGGRQLFVEWLEQAGFRVIQAHNGLQAFERAVEGTPDVVVTDLNIPGIDGFELTRRLRQHTRTRDVPVVAVTGYAAFAADPSRALCVDMLAPEGYGEIIGGSQRIHDHDLLLRRIQEHGLPLEAFRWYLDIRKYGSVPHAGFGMGIERFVCWVAGIHHLREAIPYPRTLNRLYP